MYWKVFRPLVRLWKFNRNYEMSRLSGFLGKALDARVGVYLKLPLGARVEAAKKDKLVAKSTELYIKIKKFRVSVGLEID
jgi:hypothetical protein